MDQSLSKSKFDLLSLLFCETTIENIWLLMRFATRGEKDDTAHIKKEEKKLNQC